MSKLTAEEMAMLTAEERAGMEEGENFNEESVDTKGTLKEGEDAAIPGSPAAQAAERAANEETEAARVAAEVRIDTNKVPLIRADVPADAKDRLAAIATERTALTEQFDDGDITGKEYQAALDKLQDERETLRETILKANLSAEMTEQQATQSWVDDVNTFLTEFPGIRKNDLVYQAFDQVVRSITDPKAESAKLPNRKQLEMAYAVWCDKLGIEKPKAAAVVPAKPAVKPGREVPPTLGKVPAAQATETDESPYAALDHLMDSDPLAYEAALGKMTDAERDHYNRAA